MLFFVNKPNYCINPLNDELNTICHLMALLGAHHILHVGRIRVNVYIVYLSISNCYFNKFLYGIYDYINIRKKGNILLKVHAFI
jgi:hypothetical protein